MWSFLVVLPPLIFLLVAFVYPMGKVFTRGFYDSTVSEIIPETTALLSSWDVGEGLPSEEVYATLLRELVAAKKERTLGLLGTRLNFELSAALGVVKSTARRGAKMEAPYKESMIGLSERWGSLDIWVALKRVSENVSMKHFLASVDLEYDREGSIVLVPEEERVYVKILLRTLWMSLVVSFFTLLLGFPVAHLMATVKRKHANLLLILVLLPFWTSLLVRTTSWIVLLQRNGVVNDLLVWTGLLSDDQRLSMMFNMEGTLVAMVQILLPFAILPMYSVMRTIPPSYMKAARSLGASYGYAFLRVYVPCTIPGLAAGVLLVFILSTGYYITPALLGGDEGMMISNFIAFHMKKTLNWGFAAALACVVLLGVMVLYWLYDRLVGIEKLKLG
jgi:putative spermidine/putrescine transport system permease protein